MEAPSSITAPPGSYSHQENERATKGHLTALAWRSHISFPGGPGGSTWGIVGRAIAPIGVGARLSQVCISSVRLGLLGSMNCLCPFRPGETCFSSWAVFPSKLKALVPGPGLSYRPWAPLGWGRASVIFNPWVDAPLLQRKKQSILNSPSFLCDGLSCSL